MSALPISMRIFRDSERKSRAAPGFRIVRMVPRITLMSSALPERVI